MKKFLVVFLATAAVILATVPVGCSVGRTHSYGMENPCIWMDTVCYCRGYPHKVIHTTDHTDISKMYFYCKGRP